MEYDVKNKTILSVNKNNRISCVHNVGRNENAQNLFFSMILLIGYNQALLVKKGWIRLNWILSGFARKRWRPSSSEGPERSENWEKERGRGVMLASLGGKMVLLSYMLRSSICINLFSNGHN